MNKCLRVSMLALSIGLATIAGAWAGSAEEHSQHQAMPTGQVAAAKSGHMEKMETRMAKMEVALDRLTRKMGEVKESLARAQQAKGEERTRLLMSHGQGLREVLQGLRELTQKMMNLEKKKEMMGDSMSHGAAQAGKPSGGHDSHGADTTGQGGMGGMDMQEHHAVMEKRLALLFDLMEQMLDHGLVASSPVK